MARAKRRSAQWAIRSYWNRSRTEGTSRASRHFRCCVTQGDTRAEVLRNVQEAITLYIEDCNDAGDPIPNEVGKEYVEVETGV